MGVPFGPAEVQAAASHTQSARAGLMSEGWSLNPETYVNDAAVAVITQRQNGAFCTLLPDTIATCSQPLQSFPTWRDRAKMSSC